MTSAVARFPRVRSEPSSRRVPPRVLLVSEDAALTRSCGRALEQAGYTVTCARHSGHALLECLSGNRADILLTELSMSDGSGPALSARIRRYFPGIPALYFADAGAAFADGPVLMRPFSRDELVARVHACLKASPAS